MKKSYRIDSARLKGWDYSSEGAYLIGLNTKFRVHSFGKVENGKMILSEIGEIAHAFWQQIPIHTKTSILDEFIIMPDHIHGIIFLDYSVCLDGVPPRLEKRKGVIPVCTDGVLPRLKQELPRKSIATIIGTFKSVFTKTINQKFPEAKFQWQERFYDHIIRNNEELNRLRNYISNNPKNYCNEKFK